MSSSDSEGPERAQMLRMLRIYRRERRRPFEYARFIPELMQELFVDDGTFLERFGLDPFEFEELHSMVEGRIRRYHTRFRDNIGSRERLAIGLRFLASGLSMVELSRHYEIPYTTVPVMVRQVCKTISQCLMPIVMPHPTTQMWEKNARDFKNKYDMPNCIGALEGKNLLVNGQKIVLLAVVDAHDRFVMVDVGYYRLNFYRGNVMDKSLMGRRLQKKKLNVPPDKPITDNSEPLPFVILASSFFPPKPYLMIKYSRPECKKNDTNKVFNARISRAKLTVNRALMRLRNRWRVFQKPLPVSPTLVEKIVLSCCCLHNYFALRVRQPFEPEDPDAAVAITQDRLDSLLELLPTESRDVRDKFKRYFLSPEGQVPWQWHDILS